MNVVKRKVLTNIFKSHRAIVRLNHEDEIKSIEKMPGPKTVPGQGTMLEYLPGGQYDFQRLPETYAKMQKQFGDIIREDVHPSRRLVHVFSPIDMEKVYYSDGKFPRRLSHTALGKYRQSRPQLYGNQGLLPTNGEEWANFRNIFQRSLFFGANVNLLASHFEKVTDDLIEIIPNHLDEFGETDLTPLLYRWGLESIAYITLNKRLGCLTKDGNPNAEDLIKAAEDTHVAIYETESTPMNYEKNYKLLEEAQDLIGTFVHDQMKSFLANESWPEENCVLSRLLQCKGADEKKVLTMLVDMFLAGIDSSSFTLSFALYNLATNQSVQDKLRQEIMGCLPTLKDKFGTKGVRYLSSVFRESLRINPISVGNGRLLNKDLVLSGYLVPKDTMVILQHQIASKSEKNFENADKFMPERSIHGKSSPVVHSPFGHGSRICIGKTIAEKKICLALAKFVRNFEISYHHEPIGSKTMLLNVPDKPLRLRLRQITQ